VKEAPDPDANGLPFLVTLQASVKPAAASALLGSVAEPVREMAAPSGLLAGAPPMTGVGATLVTAMVLVSVPAPPSLSVAVRVTPYRPLSSGVKVNEAAPPEAKAAPFFVTLQA